MAIYKHKEINKADKLKNDLIFMAVSLVVLYWIQRAFDWLMKPLNRESRDSDWACQVIEDKQKARDDYLEYIDSDPNDPMFQFQLRFIEEPKTYKKDPDTIIYKTWYEEWKKGDIIDSTLRWVPEVYIGETFNTVFLEYMKIQYALHLKAPIANKMKFLKTIHKFYPEFTASFKGLEQDLAMYCADVTEEKLRGTLEEEIEKYGLPGKFAEYLAKQDLSAKELKRQAEFLKGCVERGYKFASSVCALENGVSLVDALIIDKIVAYLPGRVGLAYLRKELTDEEMIELAKYYKTLLKLFGGLTNRVYEELDKELKIYRNKKRAVKYA